MDESTAGARITVAATGAANVSTGLPVLDHLLTELAQAARFKLALEVMPGGADEAVGSAGRMLGEAIATCISASGAAGQGSAIALGGEALAMVALERAIDPALVTNVDFSGERVGGIGTDVASRFLRELAQAARLNLHVRLVEGTDPQHVLAAIFKAVGRALGQACRSVPEAKEDES